MFRSISWGQYFTTILVLVIIYWLVIAALYFKSDLLQLLKSKKPVTIEDNPAGEKEAAGEKESADGLFTTVAALKRALQQVLTQGNEKRWIKEELLMALRGAVQQCLELKGTAFQVAINNYIAGESKSQCGHELTDVEIQQLW